MNPVRWNEITAIYGGTFDPPHRAHREAIRGLLSVPGVRRVRVIPTGQPHLKTAQTAAPHRLAMAKLMIEGLQDCHLDEREATASRPSYTYDTLESLKREEKDLAFVIGTDQLEKLPQWNRFPAVLGLCHWIVLKRKPEDAEGVRAALATLVRSNLIGPTADPELFEVRVGEGGKVLRLVPTDAPPVSSTEIRRCLALTGTPPEGALTREIHRYLKENRLYGT